MVTLKLTRDQCIVIDKALNGWPSNDERGGRITDDINRALVKANEERLPEPWEYED